MPPALSTADKDEPPAPENESKQTKPESEPNPNSDLNRKPLSKSNRRKIRQLFGRAKRLVRKSHYEDATRVLRYILSLNSADGHSYVALAKIYAKRSLADRHDGGENGSGGGKNNNMARETFAEGVQACGSDNVHLLQAWAVYETNVGNVTGARALLERAREVDEFNPYVCHAYGLLEMRAGNVERAQFLWYTAIHRTPTAALACSLGHLELNSNHNPNDARHVYAYSLDRVSLGRERTEILLAWATLEERIDNDGRAVRLIELAIRDDPGDGRAHIALARLEGRRNGKKGRRNGRKGKENCVGENVGIVKGVLAEASKTVDPTLVKDGRIFNVWASLEANEGNFGKARKILEEALESFPNDHTILQAAGKVEERAGKLEKAEEFYKKSIDLQTSARSLLALAMIEIKKSQKSPNSKDPRVHSPALHLSNAVDLFEKAIAVDPRHGAVYNAYGTLLLRRGRTDVAREIFARAVAANCTDITSVYHGYAKVELSEGNIDAARTILREGLRRTNLSDESISSSRTDRKPFLSHALGMLELNSHRVADAQEVFYEAIERFGNNSQLLLGAGLCEVRLGKDVAARGLLERSVYADRRHAHAWQVWGVMEGRAGNFRAAKTLFEGGIKYCPEHGALWQAYATMESRLGNFDVAARLFATGIEKCSNHVPLYQAWACLELRGGNFAAAKKLILESLNRNKSQGATWLVAAKIEEKQDNLKGMESLLRQGLEHDPNHAPLYCNLANHLVQVGKYDEGRQLLETGLKIDPLHAPLYHSLAELEASVFNLEGLAVLNRRAAAVFNNNALEPPPESSAAWGNKIKMKKIMSERSHRKLPKKVAAVARELDIDEDVAANAASGEWERDVDFDFDALVEFPGGYGDDVDLSDIFLQDGGQEGSLNGDKSDGAHRKGKNDFVTMKDIRF